MTIINVSINEGGGILKSNTSKVTVDRLALYFRTLKLLGEAGRNIVSSAELGRQLDLMPELIRRDLASFGHFGKKGMGYIVPELTREIAMILGLQSRWNFVVVGMGHLGEALTNYKNFSAMGFRFQAVFDVDPNKVGTKINGIPVYHIDKLPLIAKESPIHIGAIAVPESEAQVVADLLVAAGVKGIWNFTPRRINTPPEICIMYEDLSVKLSSLSYYISEGCSVRDLENKNG